MHTVTTFELKKSKKSKPISIRINEVTSEEEVQRHMNGIKAVHGEDIMDYKLTNYKSNVIPKAIYDFHFNRILNELADERKKREHDNVWIEINPKQLKNRLNRKKTTSVTKIFNKND